MELLSLAPKLSEMLLSCALALTVMLALALTVMLALALALALALSRGMLERFALNTY